MEARDRFVIEQGKEIYRDICFDILDSMIDKVKVIDKDRNVIYYNKAMKEAARNIIVGKSCYCMFERDGYCEVCTSKLAMERNKSFEKEEIIDGKIYTVNSSPLKDKEGHIYGAVEVYRDVTREKRLELEITSKNEEMISDLNFSKTMQTAILPPKGKLGDVIVDYFYTPCATLSGDMFDVFETEDGKVAFYIADVAGHGVTTSMTTMFIRQTIRNAGTLIENPKDMLGFLHREYCLLHLNVDKYFTIFYGVYDKKHKKLRYANAGHNAEPIMVREKSVERLRIEGLPIISLFEKPDYSQKEISIFPGDRLFLFTDGIIEAQNRFKEQFGMERLEKELRDAGSVDEAQKIKETLDAFVYGAAADDYTFLKLYFLA